MIRRVRERAEIKRRINLNTLRTIKKIGYIIICFLLIFFEIKLFYASINEITQQEFDKNLKISFFIFLVTIILTLLTKLNINYKRKIYFWIGIGTCIFIAGMIMILILRKMVYMGGVG